MGGTARGRTALVFLLVLVPGELLALALTPKVFFGDRTGVQGVRLDWESFLWLSVVSVVVAGVCAYRTWRGRAKAAAAPGAS